VGFLTFRPGISLPKHRENEPVRLPQLQEGRVCSIKSDPYLLEIRSVLKQTWEGISVFIQPIPGKDKRKMNEVKGLHFSAPHALILYNNSV
jgi:hypothetical protein